MAEKTSGRPVSVARTVGEGFRGDLVVGVVGVGDYSPCINRASAATL